MSKQLIRITADSTCDLSPELLEQYGIETLPLYIIHEGVEHKDGIDIIIKPFTKNESVHIPVIISKTGHSEMVYNDFYIGEGADVTIVAGCGIHNTGDSESRHDGIHAYEPDNYHQPRRKCIC